MANRTTVLQDLINPEVMADMISATLEKKIVVTPFAKIDGSLEGRPGSTITIPHYQYIGAGVDVAEGVACGLTNLETGIHQATIKKAMKAVGLTDEAILSGYGDPVGEAVSQLSKAIADKIDEDCIDALGGATLVYTDASNTIGYTPIVDAIDIFEEEVNTEKVMFIHPKQVTQLRKDANFISADKYNANVIMRGEIGMICNTRIVPSKRVKKFATFYNFSDASGAKTIVETGASTNQVNLADVTPSLPTAKVGDKVVAVSTACYFNPIVQLTYDAETEPATAALTIFLKRGVNLETERHTLSRTTDISVDQFYVADLTDESKVVMAKIKA